MRGFTNRIRQHVNLLKNRKHAKSDRTLRLYRRNSLLSREFANGENIDPSLSRERVGRTKKAAGSSLIAIITPLSDAEMETIFRRSTRADGNAYTGETSAELILRRPLSPLLLFSLSLIARPLHDEQQRESQTAPVTLAASRN